MMTILTNSAYLISTLLFILGMKKLSSPSTARLGNRLSAIGMLLAVCVTLLQQSVIGLQTILIGLIIGAIVGVIAARWVAMTAMPEMVALLNGFGGGSSMLLAWGVIIEYGYDTMSTGIVIIISIIIGGLTLSGSIVAWGKLSGKISGRPLSIQGHNIVILGITLGIVVMSVILIAWPEFTLVALYIIIGWTLLLGMIIVAAIGGGDMPVVIALLNSLSGIAASAAGFVVSNVLLMVAGLLVGASGLILTIIMCKAMNRTLTNVLFGGFGSSTTTNRSLQQGDINPITSEDAYLILEAAQSVVIVPGYGMAVAQAQHAVRELTELLEENGCEINFAIHPVAGRMPGHMNVLLAEASVPYDRLIEMDDINPNLDQVDVCLVIGANDVVNPDALEDRNSPIYGMPIIEAMKAKTVFVLKRSMKPGFAGIENPLFFKENTRMLFGDAKTSIQSIITEFKE